MGQWIRPPLQGHSLRHSFAPLAAALLAAAAPASAEVLPGQWRHAPSGLSLPLEFGDMKLVREYGLSRGGNFDVAAQYGQAEDPVTIYVYRAAYPNAALWFERVRHAMKRSVGKTGGQVAPRGFTLGGAGAPNALREEVALDGGQWKSSSVAIAQLGEWLVKARVSSRTLDPAGVAARMDNLLAAIRFERPAPKPLPLAVPGPCGDVAQLRGRPLPRAAPGATGAAAAAGLAVVAAARGAAGLAAEPSAWCRESSGISPDHASLYRDRAGTGWVALFGDSGMAVSAVAVGQVTGSPAMAAAYATNPTSTRVVALYDSVPAPEPAIAQALPVLAGQATGLAEIKVEPGGQPR